MTSTMLEMFTSVASFREKCFSRKLATTLAASPTVGGIHVSHEIVNHVFRFLSGVLYKPASPREEVVPEDSCWRAKASFST